MQNARVATSPEEQTERNDTGIQEEEGEKMAVDLHVPSYLARQGPPLDDCCPICFDSFSIPCRANCGHWFCGDCIVQYWKFGGVCRACKCPMCCSRVTKLTPEASFNDQQEEEVTKVLKQVDKYNRFFVQGVPGVVQKVRWLAYFFIRIFEDLMDPDGRDFALNESFLRIFAMLLAALYLASPFNFIPLDRNGVIRLFDFGSLFVAIILRLVGFYRRRRRLNWLVRELDAAEPLVP